MSEFKAKIIAELDTSRIQPSINKIAKTPIRLTNVKIDNVTVNASKIVSQIQSALNKAKININIAGLGGGSGGGSGSAGNSLIGRINKELSSGAIGASVEKLNAQFQKTYGFLTKIGSVDLKGTRLEQFGQTGAEALKSLEAEFKEVQRLETALATAQTPQEQIKAYTDLQNATAKFRNNLTLLNAESKIMASSFDVQKIDNGFSSWLEKNSKAVKVFGNDIQAIQSKINDFQTRLATGGTVTQGELLGLTQEINSVKVAAESAGAVGQTFGDRLKMSFDRLSRYVSAATVIYTTINATKQMINTVVQLDDALVDLQKTTTASAKELNNFYYEANDIAKQYGTTTQEVIQSTADWSRLGYNLADSRTMAKTSSLFKSISPGATIEDATSGLVSIMKAFDISAEDAMDGIASKINIIGNNFAVSNTDILEGLKRSSAAMSAMGQDLDSTIALFTGAQEVLQDAPSTGTALRSMSLRMRGFDEETEEVSEDLVNITGDIIDLTKTAEHAQGVSIFTDETQTQYKDFVDYFRELSEVWDEMSAKNQTALLNKLFGKRGAQAGSALIKNFETVEAALQKMQNSAGNAEKEMGIITQSLSYKLNALKETGTGIAQNLFARKDIGVVVDGLTSLLGVVDALTDKLGLFGTIGAGAGLFQFFRNIENLQNIGKVSIALSQMSNGASAVQSALAGMTTETLAASMATMGLSAAQAAQLAISQGMTAAEAAKTLALAGFTAAETSAAMAGAGYTAAETSAAVATTAFTTSASAGTGAATALATAMYNLAAGVATFLLTNPAGWFILFAAGAAAAMAVIDSLTLSYEEAKEAADASASNYQTTASEAESLKAKIDANNESIDRLKAQGTLSLTDQADLANLEAQNKSLENQYAIKQKMANLQLKQAGKDAYTALTTTKSYSSGKMVSSTNGYGQQTGSVVMKEGSILDETIDKYEQLQAAEKEYDDLLAKQAKLDPEKDKQQYQANEKRLNTLSEKQKTLSNDISTNLDDISGLYNTLSASNDVFGAYDKELADIENVMNKLTSDSDKAASKQEKINNLLRDSKYSDAAKDMLEYAKAQGEAGITGDDIKKNFSDIADAANDAGIDINDLAQTINAMTGSVNIDEVTKQLNKMKDAVSDTETKDFLTNLFDNASDEELKMYYSIMASNDTGSWSIEDWQDAIERFEDQEVDIEFNITAETDRLDKLREAITESRGDTGLSQDTIETIRTKFGDMDGFDESRIFYNTANGVRANSDALKELQRQYVNLKKTDLNNQLQEQKKGYEEATAALKGLKEGTTEFEEASAKVEYFDAAIDQTQRLISQYNALTSAYNEWIAAQNAGNERDMYQNAASGYEATGKLIEQGWVKDDSVQAYIDLMTYGDKASFSAEEVKARYEELGKTIEGTSYSAKDFFMVLDEEGNASVDETTGGINNFVSALKQLGEVGEEGVLDASKADEYAKALGLDVSMIETMIRAAEEAGYTVTNTWASSAASLSEVNSELETAKQSLEQFRNEDGSFNVNAEGFEEAQQKVTDLIAKKQELEQSSGVMSIDLDTAGFDEGITNAISKLQELQSALNQYEQLKAAGIDTSEAEANIQSLAQEIEGLDPQIKAQVGLEEGSDLSSQIESLASGSQVEVGAKLNDGAAASITAELNGLNAQAIVTFTSEHSEVDGYAAEEKQSNGTVTWDNNTGAVDSYAAATKTATGIVVWGNDTSNVQTSFSATGTVNWVNASGPGGFRGNAFVGGNALAGGTWGGGLGGMTLLGELSRELVVDPNTGKWYTVGDNGAEFRNIPPNAIVFNHVQTEALLKNGHINSRGHAMASGNAFASGSSDKLWDWIEIFIDRLERGIKKLEKAVDNVYKTWTDRGTSLTKEITQVKKELEAQQKAYNLYINQANGVGLDAGHQAMIKSGSLSAIESISDEGLNDRITKFKDFYEDALKAKDAVEELKEQLAELYTTAFENVEKNFDHQIKLVEHLTKTYKNGVDLLEAQGKLIGISYYKAMQTAEKKNNSLLQKELTKLVAAYNKAMNSGYIKKGSQQWYEFNEEINKTKEALQESNVELAELQKRINEIHWENFDYREGIISGITEESDFLISLLGHRELKNDDSTLTDAGLATLGLHGQNYNVYMAQANDYANSIKKLNKTIAKDPNNTQLLERREQLYELQRKMILAAEDEKDAMMDLVKEGYQAQLDSMKDLIDKYEDALSSAKNLYDYQKKVKKQTDNIINIEKQLVAYSGDTSEENRARIQKLQADLREAKEELEETEYDKYIRDQKDLLNDFYSDYEENINTRMDDVDTSISELINTVNNNYTEIGGTIEKAVDDVGYTLTNEMRAIWTDVDDSMIGVITEYSGMFDSQLTSINSVLASIDTRVANMVNESNKAADKTVKSTTSSTNVKSNKKKTTTAKKSTAKKTTAKKTTTANGGIVTPIFTNGSDRLNVRDQPSMNGKVIRQLAKGNLVGTDWKESNGWLHIHVTNSKENYWGWASKQYLKAYAKGARHVSSGYAWTQEFGNEAIFRPTENAVLTKLESGDSVLNAKATDNIFDFGNDPQGFLARLGISSGIIDPSALLGGLLLSSGKSSVDVGGISINIPIEHVEDYNDLVNQIKKDRKFEKFIQSITVDRLVGGSALAKNNIW